MLESSKQFVVLQHILPKGGHWDLMFDIGAVLATWQLSENPLALTVSPELRGLAARKIADHRRAYLDYEGPVRGGRGHITRLDKGDYRLLEGPKDAWTIQMNGSYISGKYQLICKHQADKALLGGEWEFRRLS